MKFRQICVGLICSLSLNALAANTSAMINTTTSSTLALHKPTNITKDAGDSFSSLGVPLNTYGAVDVNANIPLSIQIPKKPSGFHNPVITPLTQKWPASVPAAPQLAVKSYILIDANSGAVIAAYDPNKRLAPASLTKLMLLYITQQALKSGQIHLNDKVTVPTVAWATGGSRMFLKPHQQVSVRELISGIIVDSGNDAAVTLANYIAGNQSAFVSLMNHERQKLGMTNTHFSDVMGLPAPNHFSSARDIAVLARAIVTKYPQDLSWYGQKYFSFNGIRQPNFNKLLFIYQYAQGLKTGSTNEAGYSLASTAKEPNNPMQLIGVVLGAANGNASAEDSKALLTYGFRFFKSKLIYPQDSDVYNARVYRGNHKYVKITVPHDVWVTYPRSMDKDSLSGSLTISPPLIVPIQKGQVLGTIDIKLNRETIAKVPAIAANTINKGDFWDRLRDRI